ncbi:unnamed protein product [Adineta steineri]|uniref:Uncharacterized protein n=1 Tax=Adineta steineri TaxID=433720 RepID=A0A819SSN5_9BILA|nr:unnamed protein product [Adineta steineri]CAF4064287.1 unnamed protein product [Adineta steineri]
MKAFYFVTLLLISSFLLINGDNCQQGLTYCGSTLMSIGKYAPQIAQAANNDNGDLTNHFLFNCLGGEHGNIVLVSQCSNGCRDNGSGVSDSCA